jgi:hypothetical protein
MRLTREAKMVLDIFRALYIPTCGTLRFDAIFEHVRAASQTRKGVSELQRLGLIVGNGKNAELTPAGYEEMWSVN